MGTVYIIDEDKEFLEEIREVLETQGLQTETFCHGWQAMERLAMDSPDIIILDLKIHETEGFETAKMFSTHEATKEVPIMAISAVYDKYYVQSIMEAYGFWDLLTKPIKPQELLRKVDKLMQWRLLNLEVLA